MYVLYSVCEMVARGCVGLVVDTVKKLRSGGPDFVSPQCSSTLSCNHFGCHGEGKNFPNRLPVWQVVHWQSTFFEQCNHLTKQMQPHFIQSGLSYNIPSLEPYM